MGLYQDFNAIVVGDNIMGLKLYSTQFFSHLVTDQSFRHNLNQASSQNTYLLIKQSFRHNLKQASNGKHSLTKVVTFDVSKDNM